MYTTLVNNDILELKMPAQWINAMLLNVTKNDNLAFNQQKLWYILGLGYLEYFQGESDEALLTEAQITDEWNESCKEVRSFMLHLWSKSRKVKCGDDGYVAPTGEEDPLAAENDGSISIDKDKQKK